MSAGGKSRSGYRRLAHRRLSRRRSRRLPLLCADLPRTLLLRAPFACAENWCLQDHHSRGARRPGAARCRSFCLGSARGGHVQEARFFLYDVSANRAPSADSTIEAAPSQKTRDRVLLLVMSEGPRTTTTRKQGTTHGRLPRKFSKLSPGSNRTFLMLLHSHPVVSSGPSRSARRRIVQARAQIAIVGATRAMATPAVQSIGWPM